MRKEVVRVRRFVFSFPSLSLSLSLSPCLSASFGFPFFAVAYTTSSRSIYHQTCTMLHFLRKANDENEIAQQTLLQTRQRREEIKGLIFLLKKM